MTILFHNWNHVLLIMYLFFYISIFTQTLAWEVIVTIISYHKLSILYVLEYDIKNVMEWNVLKQQTSS